MTAPLADEKAHGIGTVGFFKFCRHWPHHEPLNAGSAAPASCPSNESAVPPLFDDAKAIPTARQRRRHAISVPGKPRAVFPLLPPATRHATDHQTQAEITGFNASGQKVSVRNMPTVINRKAKAPSCPSIQPPHGQMKSLRSRRQEPCRARDCGAGYSRNASPSCFEK